MGNQNFVQKYCHSCGRAVGDYTNFCPNCGAHLNEISESRELRQTSSDSTGAIWVFIGLISAIISIFILPPAFGIFGVVCGSMAIKRGSSFGGGFIILISLICMIIGFVYGAMVWQQKFMQFK